MYSDIFRFGMRWDDKNMKYGTEKKYRNREGNSIGHKVNTA
jgi:hypothetical protein